MDKNMKTLLVVGVVGLAAYQLFFKKSVSGWFTPSAQDPAYMLGDPENGPYVSANYPVFTGGTFLHPEYLPPVRTYHLQ